MNIEKIKICNFRNIKKAELSFGKKINLVLGNNAQGKTNIIEAIYFTSFIKSFRTHKKTELIKEGEGSLFLKTDVFKNNVNNNISIELSKTNKRIKINNKSGDVYNYLNVIIFHPDEVNYLNNYPIFRRNLIDRSIFYNNFSYIDIYKKYYRCLKQRNSYLKEGIVSDDIWIDQLVKYGSYIIKERISYIDKINNYFKNNNFRKVNMENYLLSYSKSYSEKKSVENLLYEEFEKKQKRERLLGYTLVGPHKDDIGFYLNDRPAEGFASQGQKRSLLISFKTAQILDYKAVHGHYPVLILDDMTSELDSNRKSILLENLIENSGQVFITSTDFKQTNFYEQTKVFKVNNGEISVAD